MDIAKLVITRVLFLYPDEQGSNIAPINSLTRYTVYVQISNTGTFKPNCTASGKSVTINRYFRRGGNGYIGGKSGEW